MTLKHTIKEFATYLDSRESILDRDYPRVAGQIELLWGYVEFYRYLEKLLITEKGRDRSGFPFEAVLELDKLKEIHERLYPRAN